MAADACVPDSTLRRQENLAQIKGLEASTEKLTREYPHIGRNSSSFIISGAPFRHYS